MNTILIGTSRLHRPFCKRKDGLVYKNIIRSNEIYFLELGYFHTCLEALQILRYVSGLSIESPAWKFVFRKENPITTPGNIFNLELERAIRSGSYVPYHRPNLFDKADSIIVEISSLTHNLYRPTLTAVHTNPNFEDNWSYRDIYPEGFYKKYRNDLPVDTWVADVQEVSDILIEIVKLAGGRRVLIMGHLSDGTSGTKSRAQNNLLIKSAAEISGAEYFDTNPFSNEHGFAVDNGVVDIHHLSDAGEIALGLALQNVLG